ncbi:hypothetical protein GCM10011325_44330 [Dyadobacter sediminis]|nr:hypothetical protein GCM10011325_44330 [Dyadobacter sediminis]
MGALLIAAECLLFDKNPNFNDFDSVSNGYSKDSFAVENVAVHHVIGSEYRTTIKDKPFSSPSPEQNTRTYYKPEKRVVQNRPDLDDQNVKLYRTTKKFCIDNEKIYGNKRREVIKNEGNKLSDDREDLAVKYMNNQKRICLDVMLRSPHCKTDTFISPHVPDSADTLEVAGKKMVAQSGQKQVRPKDIFDSMHHTVRNKVSASLTISLFPNPVRDKLVIVAPDWDNMESIQLFTIYGKSVYKAEPVQNEIHVGSFASGMYVVMITSKDGSQHSQKVLINTE